MASLVDGRDLTFSLDVGGDGAASLRTTIMKKLSEFMGSYTDDVLAEYVLVLVGHGKHRMQAINDLKAFLGDQSEAFVSWLWDHLGSNIHLYASSHTNGSSLKFDMGNVEQLGETEVEKEIIKGTPEISTVKEKSHEQMLTEGGRLITFRKDITDTKMRKEMGSTVSLNNTQGESSGLSRAHTYSAKRSRSPDSWAQNESSVSEKLKRHLSPPRINATRRLLQSAVREAIAPNTGHTKPNTSHTKRVIREEITSISGHSRRGRSSIEHIQSTVSATVEDSEITTVQHAAEDQHRPISRQSKRARPAIMMAMKAAAAAAEDASKSRGRLGGNIWERLGKKPVEVVDDKAEENARYIYEGGVEARLNSEHDNEQDMNRQRLEKADGISEGSIEDAVVSNSRVDDYVEQSASSRNIYQVKRKERKYDVESNGENFVSDDNGRECEHMKSTDRRTQSQEESVRVEYRVARNTEGTTKESHLQKGSGLSSALASPSQKIVNISVNVNTWKHGSFEKLKETGSNEQTSSIPIPNQPQEQLDRIAVADTTNANLEQENAGDLKVHDAQREVTTISGRQPEVISEAQKAAALSLPAGPKQARKPDDAESRTVFITNIHFAASKESVMAHFASCGDMGRVVMLTDGATGQPKGSAYIEFKTKDAADRALILNESSFFSRPLKVVRKDAAIQAMQEMNPLMHSALMRRPIPLALRLPLRGRFIRGSPFLVPRRFPAMPRPYGNFPSLQWKRDTAIPPSAAIPPAAAIPPSTTAPSSVFATPVRPARSLSYVRASNTTGAPLVVKTVEKGSIAAPEESGKDVKLLDVGNNDTTCAPSAEMDDVEMEQA